MHVRLIDANSVGYAQHHAQPVAYVGEMQTQAISGMLNHVRRSIQYAPQILNVFIWDGRAQWRYDLHPGYKAGRHRTAEQREARAHYEAQRPWIQRALSLFPVVQLTHPHAEADDVGFGASRQLAKQGNLISVFSADFDWLQMVSNRCQWVNARKPSTHTVDLDNFSKESGGYPRPDAVADLKALTGDVSDDIDGLPDVALKRAGGLLARYGTLEAILAAAEDFMAFSTEPKYFHGLMVPETRALIMRNKQLVDLSRAPALSGNDINIVEGQFCDLELLSLFIDLGLKQYEESFSSWERTLGENPMNASDVQYVRRAVAQIAASWPAAASAA